jgi:signal transduction histidine kinase
MIATQAARLSHVVDDILLASRIERGEVRVEAESVDLAGVVHETLRALEAHLPPESPVVVRLDGAATAVRGDHDRIQQVLMNLVDNATKYSTGGEIVVSSRRVDGGVRVEVADDGPGIPPTEQRRIFGKFYRGDTHVAHGPSGTGLGLYISRELVERMGGRMGILSEPGSGSVFYFDLPSVGEPTRGGAAGSPAGPLLPGQPTGAGP